MSALFGSLTHFQAMVFFALTVSVTFAFLSKQSTPERVKYLLWAFVAFLLVAIGIGWLMYPFSQ
jgi:hypothetical protein